MKPEQAASLFRLLIAAYPRAKVEAETTELWLAELRQFDFALGERAVRSLIVGLRLWPSIADLHEQVEIIREQVARARREEERRAANEELDEIERPPLREIPDLLDKRGQYEEAAQMRDFLLRQVDVPNLPAEGTGPCSDCGHEGRLFRLGKFQVCAECARSRLRAGRRLADEAQGGAAR